MASNAFFIQIFGGISFNNVTFQAQQMKGIQIRANSIFAKYLRTFSVYFSQFFQFLVNLLEGEKSEQKHQNVIYTRTFCHQLQLHDTA